MVFTSSFYYYFESFLPWIFFSEYIRDGTLYEKSVIVLINQIVRINIFLWDWFSPHLKPQFLNCWHNSMLLKSISYEFIRMFVIPKWILRILFNIRKAFIKKYNESYKARFHCTVNTDSTFCIIGLLSPNSYCIFLYYSSNVLT